MKQSAKNKEIEAFLISNHNKQINKESGAKFKQLLLSPYLEDEFFFVLITLNNFPLT